MEGNKTDFNNLISEFENSLYQERKRNEDAEKLIKELEWENMNLNMSIASMEKIIEDEHPVIQKMINVLKLKEERLSEINKKIEKKDAEIQRLKDELVKSEKFTSEHIGFLMEALRREPFRVIIES